MSIIDIVLGSLLILGAVRGFMKGLFVEVASLLALVLGVWGAMHFSSYASDLLKSQVSWNEKTLQIVGFAITFLLIVITIGLAGKALTKLANFIFLGLLNKLLGALFGTLKIGLILSIVLLLLNKIKVPLPFLSPEELKESQLYVPVKAFAPSIFPGFKELSLSE
jgi:membrane protein required for colicin V production